MILATAGHIDHGKTALVQALTGVDADRLPEEKRRGLTIDLGFAYATLPDGAELGFVDVPGHERFLPNMLAGVLSIDRVLLVVAADDGPRPQTIEHLDILELIGVAEITGVVTKIDRVEPERATAVASEVADLLAAAGYAQSPIFAVSSRTGAGIAALAAHLQQKAHAAAAARAATPPAGLFRMPIDRAFTLPGIGLVVTGTVAAGAIAVGDRLMLSPARRSRRGCAGCTRRTGRSRPPPPASAAPSTSPASFADGAEPRRGDWLVAPERHMPATRIDLLLRASRHAEAPLRDGLPVHLHLGTADVVGRLAVLGQRTIAPGDTGFAQVDLDHRVGALYGDRALLRDHAARHTLAGGRVVDPFAPRRGRRLPARLAWLAAMAPTDPAAALAQLLAAEGAVDLAHFALVRNLAAAELDALCRGGGFLRVGPDRAPVAVTAERLAALGEALAAALAAWHEALPDALGPSRPALFEKAARRGARGGARGRTGAARRRRPGGARRRLVAPARAPAAAHQRRREAVGAGSPVARRRRVAPAAGARDRRGAVARTRGSGALSRPRRAPRPGRQGRRQPLFPAGNVGPTRRHRPRAGRCVARGKLYRADVQGPLRRRPQSGDPHSRIS